MLTLTVLGCDGSHVGAGGAASGYLVRSWTTGTTVWLDAGPGTFANLQLFCDPASLDAIVLSHEHSDHWSDIAGFVTAAHHTLGSARAPVPGTVPSTGTSTLLRRRSSCDCQSMSKNDA